MARTEVFPLTKDDTIQGLIQKIRTTSASKVIIFSDSRAPLLRSEINLRLLKFYSEEEGTELTLVVKDRAVKRLAARLGVKTEESLERKETEAKHSQLPIAFETAAVGGAVVNADRPAPPPPKISTTGRLAIALLFMFFSFVAGSYLLFKPRVTLVVYPAYKDWLYTVQGEVSLDFTDRDVTRNLLPSRLIEKQGQVSYSMPTSGRKRVGYKPARGKVILINTNTTSIVVPKGTVVATPTGLSFVTTKNVVVPKKITNYLLGIATGEVYGQAEVEVEALEKGTVGNVKQKSITTIVGHLAKSLRVVNTRDFTTGEDRFVSTVEEEDLIRGEEEARRQMGLQAREEVKKLVENDYLFLPDLVQVEVEKVEADPPVGAESTSVTVNLIYRVKAAVVGKNSLYKCLQHNLSRNLPAEFIPVNNEIVVKDFRIQGKELRRSGFTAQAGAKVRGKIDKRVIFKAIAGKTLEEASTILTELAQVGRVEFRGANGIKRIPKYSFQVRMLVPSEK